MKLGLSIFLMIVSVFLFGILFIPVLLWNTISRLLKRETIFDYYKNVAVGIDQAGGSVLYNQEKFTVSSWTYYLCSKGHKENCMFEKFINLFFGKTHCADSFKNEIHEIKEDGEIV